MTPLIQSYIAAIIRAALTALGVWLAKKGYDASQTSAIVSIFNPDAISGALIALISLAWSLWHKTSVNSKLVAAAATRQTAAAPIGSPANPIPLAAGQAIPSSIPKQNV